MKNKLSVLPFSLISKYLDIWFKTVSKRVWFVSLKLLALLSEWSRRQIIWPSLTPACLGFNQKCRKGPSPTDTSYIPLLMRVSNLSPVLFFPVSPNQSWPELGDGSQVGLNIDLKEERGLTLQSSTWFPICA